MSKPYWPPNFSNHNHSKYTKPSTTIANNQFLVHFIKYYTALVPLHFPIGLSIYPLLAMPLFPEHKNKAFFRIQKIIPMTFHQPEFTTFPFVYLFHTSTACQPSINLVSSAGSTTSCKNLSHVVRTTLVP